MFVVFLQRAIKLLEIAPGNRLIRRSRVITICNWTRFAVTDLVPRRRRNQGRPSRRQTPARSRNERLGPKLQHPTDVLEQTTQTTVGLGADSTNDIYCPSNKMLVIRAEQMKVLERSARLDFDNRVAHHLVEVYEGVVDSPDLRELIRRGVDKAGSYGIESQVGVVAFIEKMIEWGADFDEDPERTWAGEILRDGMLSPEARMPALERYSKALGGDQT
jgi:hypothetical protein